MPKYIINVREIHVQPHLVEANNPKEAIELGEKMIERGEGSYEQYSLEFSHTLDKSFWTVDEIS